MKSPIYYSSQEHGINADAIAEEAKIVLRELKQAGYEAYLVGGGVRDLCLGKTPKDFDIATNAKPEEIKPLFRHCLLIGRRFRLAHVRFRKMIIEVATFRAGDSESDDLIVHDNTWGTPEDDVVRRDFTINGLFYDIETNTVIDYTDGFKDLKDRVLRCIGDPHTRFRQDPVRMIRLIKFKARYPEMNVDPKTLEALIDCKEEITKSSSSRVLEEILRMLESGYSAEFFDIARQWSLLPYLMPHLSERLSSKDPELILNYLKTCDRACLILDPKPHRDVLFACLVYSLMEDRWKTTSPQESLFSLKGHEMAAEASVEIESMTESLRNIPKRMKAAICQIIGMQPRIAPLDGPTKRVGRLYTHPDFPYALELLQLRRQLDPSLDVHIQFWKQFLTQTATDNPQAFENVQTSSREKGQRKPKRQPRHPRGKTRKCSDSQERELLVESDCAHAQAAHTETERVPAMKNLLTPPTSLIQDSEWT